MDLSQLYDEIARCNKCGFCQVACPVFRATGQETGVARGRVALLRALLEDRMSWSRNLEEPLFNCLLCGACTANCFPAVATADLMLAARSEYVDRVGRKLIHRLLFDHLLPYPSRLKLAVRSVALGKRSGLSDLACALGLLRFLGRDLAKAEGILERLPDRTLRDEFRPGVLTGRGASLRVGYFVGCGTDLVTPHAGRASLQSLLDVAASVEVLDNNCCGLPAASYGDRNAAQRLARQNLSVLGSDRFNVIVTDCSSCASFLKKYAAMFDVGEERARASAAAARVKDIVEILPAPPQDGDGNRRPVVTYHDPCHARRGQRIVREPREILRSLPGVEFREMPEADWCCGGAGSYALSHYDLSRKVLDRKISNIAKTEADVVVTSCPACMIHLSYGIRMHGLGTRVQHLSEVTAGHRFSPGKQEPSRT
jgi:glycolate oxidase iron-sulfur subunit